jgi:hypothetical protein
VTGAENIKLSEFTTEVVKDGLKRAGKAAIDGVKGQFASSTPGSMRPSVDTSEKPPGESNDPEIEFFNQMYKALDEQATNNREMIYERKRALRPLLRTQPQVAASIMHGIGDELGRQKKFANDEQARISRLLWTAHVAKRELGDESVKTADGKSAGIATQLDRARELTKKQMPSARAGLLDIVLMRSHAFPKVASARMTGVSASIVERVKESPLLGFPMPVRFILDANDAKPTIVTRDEAGRVRVSGDLLYFVRYSSSRLDTRAAQQGEQIGPMRRDAFQTPEAEAIAGATKVVETILSQPLKYWGVEAIEHDDANEDK